VGAIDLGETHSILLGPGHQVAGGFPGSGSAGGDFRSQIMAPGVMAPRDAPLIGVLSDSLPALVPSLAISERYDTNVLNAPAIAGLDRSDFVTQIVPQLRIIPRTDGMIKGMIVLGAVGEIYAKNAALNNVGFNVTGNLDFTRAAQRLISERLTFSVNETFLYTPILPGFMSKDIPAADSTQQVDQGTSFLQGIQVPRVNTYMNSVSVSSTFATTRTLLLFLSASHNIVHFSGGTIGTGNGSGSVSNTGLIDTQGRQVSIGPRWQYNQTDNLTLVYMYSRVDFAKVLDPGASPYFETQGVMASWSGQFSDRSWYASANIGAFEASPGHQVQTNGGLNVGYRLKDTTIGAAYSRSFSPAYYGTSGPLIADVYGLQVFHFVSSQTSVNLAANYSHAVTLAGGAVASDYSFDSYMGSAAVNYMFDRTWLARIAYTYSKFVGSGLSVASGITGGALNFDRQIVMLTMTKLWY